MAPLPPNQLLHLGPDPAGASWNHFNLGLGLTSHVDYAQSQLGNSPPQGQPWWYSKTNVDGRDVAVFSAPLGGATTSSNTQYARCELREFERDGTTKMAFNPTADDHWIEGYYRIYGLTGLQKPGVCVQQAHDPNDDTIMICTVLSGGVIKLVLRYNGTQVAVLDSNYVDGREFYLKTRVNAGTPMVYYTSNLASIPTTPITTSPSSSGFFSGASTGWYFKSGSYNQTNESTDPNVNPDASIIQVEVRELKHWHSKTPAGGAWATPATYAAAPTPGGPTVSAGTDATILPTDTFSRTATVTLNGATLTSQQWKILSGPAGAGNVLSSSAAVSWAPSSGYVTQSGTQTLGVGGVFTPADAIKATADTTSELVITTSGTSSAPRVYDGGGHKVGRITVNANYVTVQNYNIDSGVQSGAILNGTGIIFQNNDIKNVLPAGTSDINAIQAFGNDIKIRYNTAINFVGAGSGGKQTLGVGGVATPAGAILATSDQPGVQLDITTSGTANNWRVYDGQGHKIGTIKIRASYVIVQNYRIEARQQYGVDAKLGGGTGNHDVIIQNCDIKDLRPTGDGDLNCFTINGNNITIAYNTAIDFVGQVSSGSHTDFCQTWNDGPGDESTSNLRVIGNLCQTVDPNVDPDRGAHQFVIGEGKDSTDGGGGGSGVSQNWFIADNTTVADCKFDDIDNVIYTRNNFTGVDKRAVVVTSLSSNFKYYSDNKITGTVTVEVGAPIIPGPGPATPVISPGGGSTFDGDCSFIQTWVDTAHPQASSNWEIVGNKATGPSNPSRVNTIASMHQAVLGEGFGRGGNTGGNGGDPSGWLISDNEFGDSWSTASVKLDGVDNVDVTRNKFTGSSTKVIDASTASTNVKYWSDNTITGSYGSVGLAATSGSGPVPSAGATGSVTVPYPEGRYTLQFTAVTSAGTVTDTVDVVISPVSGGGGGGVIGTYPSIVSVGPAATSDGSGTVTVQAPSDIVNGHFQVCIIQDPGTESFTDIPAGWQLLDNQAIVNSDFGSAGGDSQCTIFYNTTGDTAARTWTKSGTRGYHAVRMAWKDWSALGPHLTRASSFTTTPYAPPIAPTTDRALVITVMGSDRSDIGPGPVTVPTGWTERYNTGKTVNGNEIQWISVAELQVDNKARAGADAPSAGGLGTSNFHLTNPDNGAMFSFVLEGVISTTTTISGAVSLSAGAALSTSGQQTTRQAAVSLPATVTLLAWSMVRGASTLTASATLSLQAVAYPRGTLIINTVLSVTGAALGLFPTVPLTIIARLWPAAVPLRKPTLRTDFKYPPPQFPFRLIAQRILDGEIVDWELPVSDDFEYVEQLSGPIIMRGSFRPEIISVQELNLDGYAYWLHVEVNEQIRASAILLPPQYEDSAMTFSAEGIAAAPHYQIYDAVFQQIGVDPLSVVRTIWNYVQAQPQSNLHVVVSSNSSPVRLGEAARTETTVTQNEDGSTTTTIQDIPAKPYELVWWNGTNCGEEIDNLAHQTPFDYVERHEWNSTRTDVLHYFDMGYPRIGVQRPNLLFNEENILEVVPVQEAEDSYASAVLVVGSGEGADTIRGYAAQSFGDRVRKEVVITDKTITDQTRANARALTELAIRRARAFEISEIVVNAYHPNAPIGSYHSGDDIKIQVDIPWLMETHIAWYRITSITSRPSSDKIRIAVSHASVFDFTEEIKVISPDDYIPFVPPPPGVTNFPGNVQLDVLCLLTLGPKATLFAAISMPVAKTLTASGIVTTATGSTVTLIVNKTLTTNGVVTGLYGLNLGVVTTLTANAIRIVLGGITLSATPTLSAAGTVIQGPPRATLTATPTLSANGVTVKSGAVSLAAAPALAADGNTTLKAGAVSLIASKSLSADGTVTGGTSSQLGKTTNGGSSSSSSGNKTIVSSAIASGGGNVTAGHGRLWVDSGTANVEMVVYSDSSGAPGTLLGLSDTVTISNTSEAQIDFTFTGAQQAAITSGTTYWVGFTWLDPGTNNIFWSRDGTSSGALANGSHAATTFGTGSTNSGPIDAFVDVGGSGGGGGGSGSPPTVRSSSVGGKASTSDTSFTVAKPTGLVAGDYILALHIGDSDVPTSTMGSPSGFSTLDSQEGNAPSNFPSVEIYTKVATSTDASATNFTFTSGNTGDGAAILIAITTGTYSTSTPITMAGTWNTQPRTATMTQTAPSMTGVVNGLLMAIFGTDTHTHSESYPSSGPTGMTLVNQKQGTPAYAMIGAYKQALSSTTATGTKTVSPTPSGITENGWVATSLIVNPA